jgi:hypothetical protein
MLYGVCGADDAFEKKLEGQEADDHKEKNDPLLLKIQIQEKKDGEYYPEGDAKRAIDPMLYLKKDEEDLDPHAPREKNEEKEVFPQDAEEGDYHHENNAHVLQV